MKTIYYVLQLAYDGTSYYGWQKNNELPTIEGALHSVLYTLFQTDISLNAVSRTDRGVHAEGQIAYFSAPPFSKGVGQLHLSLNQLLPSDIRVITLSLCKHPPLAKAKTYLYRIDMAPFHNPFHRKHAWHVPVPLDVEAMKLAASYLLGSHDFAGFCNEGAPEYATTIRSLFSIECLQINQELHIIMKGNAFLYRMARSIVGTLVAVGKKTITPQDIQEILQHKDRKKAGMCAPAHGLVLKQITY